MAWALIGTGDETLAAAVRLLCIVIKISTLTFCDDALEALPHPSFTWRAAGRSGKTGAMPLLAFC